MSPKWLSSLLRARQSQEDAARQRLAVATSAAHRAHDRARADAARVEALQAREHEEDTQAFVAAAVAVQSAAATHAASVGDALRADSWIEHRHGELGAAALARHTAQELTDRAEREAAQLAAQVAQRDLDEAAAANHRRRDAQGTS